MAGASSSSSSVSGTSAMTLLSFTVFSVSAGFD